MWKFLTVVIAAHGLLAAHTYTEYTDPSGGYTDGSTCLPAGKTSSERRNLTYSGYNGPVMDVVFKWSSAQVTSAMVQILLQEVLGYHYDIYMSVWSTETAVLGPSGCFDMLNFTKDACMHPDSYDEYHPLVHMGLEGWGGLDLVVDHVPPERRALKLANHFYQGIEGVFFPGQAKTDALVDDKLILNAYESWDATRFPAIREQFESFGNHYPLVAEKLSATKKLKDAPYATPAYKDYAVSTGDSGPGCYNFETETLTTDSILECDGHGWVAPACRDDVNACIPIYTYGGYSLSEFRQWATFYNWPTIVIDTTWGGWANAPAMRTASNKPVPFYWWWPDHTFASLAPLRIDLPQHDPMKYLDNVFDSAIKDTKLQKYVWQHMETADDGRGEAIVYMLQRIEIHFPEMQVMMDEFGAGLSTADVACNFLRGYTARWSNWIMPIVCPTGQGLDADNLASDICGPCAAGYSPVWSNDESNSVCTLCESGTYCPAGNSAPIECPPGYMSLAGAGEATPCERGTYQNATGQMRCIDCLPGYYSDQLISATCQPCTAGFSSNSSGSESCTECPAGTYAPDASSVECTSCGGHGTLISPTRAVRKAECVCRVNFFYSEVQDKCIECGEGVRCPGGNGVPLIDAGFYGEPVRDSDGQLDALQVWRCAYGTKTCPGSAIANTDLGAVAVVEEDVRLVNECYPSELAGNGPECTTCPSHQYLTTGLECQDCDSGSIALTPIFVILMLIVMLIVYRVVSSPKNQQLTAALMLSCLGGLLCNLAQTLSIIGTFKVTFPKELDWAFAIAKFFMFDVSFIRLGCFFGGGYGARYFGRIFLPMGAVLMFLGLYLLVNTVVKFTGEYKFLQRMDLSKVLNCIGLLLSALYISICTMCLQHFKKTVHPNAPSVVTDYPDVEWDSAEHNDVTWIAVIVTMCYICGIYGIFSYICFIAPSITPDRGNTEAQVEAFAMRTKFLTMRFKPTRWYFGLLCLFRNLLLGLVGVMAPSKGAAELAITGSILVVYLYIQASAQPWRSLVLNVVDSGLSVVVSLLCTFALCIVDNDGTVEERMDQFDEILFIIVLVGFMLLFGAGIRGVIYATRSNMLVDELQKRTDHFQYMMARFSETVTEANAQQPDNADLRDRIIEALTLEEMESISSGLLLVLTELFDIDAGHCKPLSPKRVSTGMQRPKRSVLPTTLKSTGSISSELKLVGGRLRIETSPATEVVGTVDDTVHEV